MIPLNTLLNPATLTGAQVEYLTRLERGRWSWTTSWTFDGQQARSLMPVNSLTGRLELAPRALPIYQVHELPLP